MFVTFEGIEGSGKSTALRRLGTVLRRQGRDCVLTREPGGSGLGRALRGLLLDTQCRVVPEAELFLYLADRAQHVKETILPALEAGRMVLSDRYADSTIVYQGYGRGLDKERLIALNDFAVSGLWPHTTLLFDLDPAAGLERARRRNEENGVAVTEGRFEAEALDFHQRIRSGYLQWARRNPQRFVLIDASGSPQEVFRQTLAALEPLLPGLC